MQDFTPRAIAAAAVGQASSGPSRLRVCLKLPAAISTKTGRPAPRWHNPSEHSASSSSMRGLRPMRRSSSGTGKTYHRRNQRVYGPISDSRRGSTLSRERTHGTTLHSCSGVRLFAERRGAAAATRSDVRLQHSVGPTVLMSLDLSDRQCELRPAVGRLTCRMCRETDVGIDGPAESPSKVQVQEAHDRVVHESRSRFAACYGRHGLAPENAEAASLQALLTPAEGEAAARSAV